MYASRSFSHSKTRNPRPTLVVRKEASPKVCKEKGKPWQIKKGTMARIDIEIAWHIVGKIMQNVHHYTTVYNNHKIDSTWFDCVRLWQLWWWYLFGKSTALLRGQCYLSQHWWNAPVGREHSHEPGVCWPQRCGYEQHWRAWPAWWVAYAVLLGMTTKWTEGSMVCGDNLILIWCWWVHVWCYHGYYRAVCRDNTHANPK